MHCKLFPFVVTCYVAFIVTHIFSIKIDPKLLEDPAIPQDIYLIPTGSAPTLPPKPTCSRATPPDRAAQAKACKEELQKKMAASQSKVLGILSLTSIPYESFWITDRILVKNVSPKDVLALPGIGDAIDAMVPARNLTIPRVNISNSDATPPTATQWNINYVGADRTQKCTKRNGLFGVLVALIDTGVLYTHEQLNYNYLGTIVGNNSVGWLDAYGESTTPVDNMGHGSHCTGLCCGKKYIGVAPNITTWMACRACKGFFGLGLPVVGGCPDDYLLKCAQWIMSPNDNYTYVPNVVSNSWGAKGNDTWFNDVINAWLCAGIFPVFAAGNDGPDCSSLSSPGMQPGVIDAGCTNIKNETSSFSSRGPKNTTMATCPATPKDAKPLLMAPGEYVISAFNKNNNSYANMSGTSMSTPQIAGGVAQLLACNSSFTFDDITSILIGAANKNVKVTSSNNCSCPTDRVPNNIFGNGLLDISKPFDANCKCSPQTGCKLT